MEGSLWRILGLSCSVLISEQGYFETTRTGSLCSLRAARVHVANNISTKP
jgi:hypothetical protein